MYHHSKYTCIIWPVVAVVASIAANDVPYRSNNINYKKTSDQEYTINNKTLLNLYI